MDVGCRAFAMNSETSEKLAVFCLALFGVATATASPAVGALGIAGAVLSLPAVFKSFKIEREKPHFVGTLMKAIETNWRDWARRSRELNENQIAAAMAALNDV
ncbi:MAG: hypothetical protein ACREDP_23355, partial [Bradyrhizobium sp.]